jgi:hypothetical protein
MNIAGRMYFGHYSVIPIFAAFVCDVLGVFFGFKVNLI